MGYKRGEKTKKGEIGPREGRARVLEDNPRGESCFVIYQAARLFFVRQIPMATGSPPPTSCTHCALSVLSGNPCACPSLEATASTSLAVRLGISPAAHEQWRRGFPDMTLGQWEHLEASVVDFCPRPDCSVVPFGLSARALPEMVLASQRVSLPCVHSRQTCRPSLGPNIKGISGPQVLCSHASLPTLDTTCRLTLYTHTRVGHWKRLGGGMLGGGFFWGKT